MFFLRFQHRYWFQVGKKKPQAVLEESERRQHELLARRERAQRRAGKDAVLVKNRGRFSVNFSMISCSINLFIDFVWFSLKEHDGSQFSIKDHLSQILGIHRGISCSEERKVPQPELSRPERAVRRRGSLIELGIGGLDMFEWSIRSAKTCLEHSRLFFFFEV